MFNNAYLILLLISWATAPVQASPQPYTYCQAQVIANGSSALELARFLNAPPVGATPLLTQNIEDHDWDRVRKLLNWGADPRVPGPNGHNSFHRAEELGLGIRVTKLWYESQNRIKEWPEVRRSLLAFNWDNRKADGFLSGVDHYDSAILRDLLEEAIRSFHYALVRYLVEVKGLSLTPYKAPLLQDGSRPPSESFISLSRQLHNYLLWSMALLDNGNYGFWNFLIEQNFELLPSFENNGNPISVGSLFLGARSEHIPDQYWRQIPFDTEQFRVLLHRGLAPLADSFMARHLISQPEKYDYLWKIILASYFPTRLLTAEQFPFVFALFFDVGTQSLSTLKRLHSIGRELGADFAQSGHDEKSVTPLFFVESPETARHLVTEAGVDPHYISAKYRVTAAGYQKREISTHWQGRGSHVVRQRLLERMLTERLSDLQSEWNTELESLPHTVTRESVLRRLQTIDYLLHETGP